MTRLTPLRSASSRWRAEIDDPTDIGRTVGLVIGEDGQLLDRKAADDQPPALAVDFAQPRRGDDHAFQSAGVQVVALYALNLQTCHGQAIGEVLV